MSLTIVATAGAANANCYTTVAAADTYHDAHLYGSDWFSASTTDKTAALVWATRLLDQHFTWSGSIYSQTQALSWPRAATYDRDGRLQTENTIPAVIAEATAELARSLIISNRTDTETDSGAISYVTVGTIAVKYATGTVTSQAVIPDSVRSMVAHLGTYATANSGTLTVRRG